MPETLAFIGAGRIGTGVARLALRSGAPVVPVGIVGTRAVQPPGSRRWHLAPVEVNFGAYGVAAARAGVVLDRALLYGKAGVAFANIKNTAANLTSGGAIDSSDLTELDKTHIGWAAGGGVEWMYSRNWSFKAEYLYVDLGSADYRFIGTTFIGTPHTTDSFPADLTFHTVRVGVNYRF